MLLLIFFYLSSAGQTERERETEFERDWERVWESFGREMRCVIKGKDWAPFIVKWTAKIAPKRSHPTAGEKIWGDLVLNTRFSEIRCMNLFSAESRSIYFLHYKIFDRSNWTVGRSIYFLHYKIFDRSNILSQIFIRFSTYITKSPDWLINRSIDFGF